MICKICNTKTIKESFIARNQHGRHTLSKDTFTIVKCSRCDNWYIKGIKINKSYFSKYYDKNYYIKYNNGLINKLLATTNKVSIYLKYLIIKKHIDKKSNIKILDVGCGDGNFLKRIPNSVFSKTGMDINKQSQELCKEKGIKTIQGDITKISLKDTFDVITMWHVAEHLEDLKEALKNIKKSMKDNSILIIAVPNTNSLGFNIGKNNWFHLDTPRHLNITNDNTWEYIAKDLNFSIVKKLNEFYDYPLDLVWSASKSLLLPIVIILYPILKIFSAETRTYVLKKNTRRI